MRDLVEVFVIAALIAVPILQTYLLILCLEDKDWSGVVLYGFLLGLILYYYPTIIVDSLAETTR